MAGFLDRFKKAVNTFSADEEDPLGTEFGSYGTAQSIRPDRQRTFFSNEKTIVTSIYTRIAVDGASVQIRHIRLDDQNRYISDMDSGLNNCLSVEANVDQAGRHFRQDIFATLCNEGVAAIVPVDTSVDIRNGGAFDILTMRVGKVMTWYPRHVKVRVYNDIKGDYQEITLPKTSVAIVENPLYAVMNEPNSTLQRLIRKLNLLDSVDEASASGKLDLIIQLPYVIKSEARKLQAEQRRQDIEFQLKGSKYGIAYTDGTEKITQLNRPAENNLMGQVEYLTTMLYGQLGITAEVMNGTADEKTMLNYWNRTIEPMTGAIVEALRRTFLTKTARAQKQWVDYFKDPFALVPTGDMAEIADKFTRNEIMSANEIRQNMGMKPSSDPKADMLVNSNMPQPQPLASDIPGEVVPDDAVEVDEEQEDADIEMAMNEEFGPLDDEITAMFEELGINENDLPDEEVPEDG